MSVASSHIWFWQTPTWHASEAWALAVLLVVSLIPLPVPKKKGEQNAEGGRRKTAPLLIALVNGRDGRWSTSKTSAVLWTYAVWFAFITILLHTDGKGVSHAVLQEQYLILMGLPVGAAVVAKGIVQSKIERGQITTKPADGPETSVLHGIGQLISDDTGQPDLLDFQYFGFNTILLGYFFTRFLDHPELGLPSLPHSLVALSGVAAAGYLGKKGLQRDTNPAITTIVPTSAKPGQTIMIHGANLATNDSDAISVLIGDQTVPATKVTVTDTETKLEVVLPAGLPAGKTSVQVVNYKGLKTDPDPFTIAAA